MSDQNDENIQPPASPELSAPEKQLSRLALWAFRFFIFGLVCIIASAAGFSYIYSPLVGQAMILFGLVGSLMWLIAVVLGFAALFHICWRKKQFKGMPRSMISVLIPLIVCSISLYFMLSLAYRLMCGVNVDGLGKALAVYCNDYGKFPGPSRWNDLLVERADVSVGQFFCRGSDAIRGECSYAMNKYIVNMSMSQVPSDVVVLFETDYGRTANRWWRKNSFFKR